MSAHEKATAILVIVGAALLLLACRFSRPLSARLPAVGRTATRSFWCPFREQDVVVEVLEATCGCGPLDVIRCTALASGSAIACNKPCLLLAQLPEAQGGPASVSRRSGA